MKRSLPRNLLWAGAAWTGRAFCKLYTLPLASARPPSARIRLGFLLCMQTVVASNLHPGGQRSRAAASIETQSNSPIPQPHTLCPRIIKLNHMCGHFLVSTS